MTTVRIYQPPKNPRQSGIKQSSGWILTFEQKKSPSPSPPLGWLASTDMKQELCLKFPSLIRAIEYAKLNGFRYTISTPPQIEIVPKSYAQNFTRSRMRE